MSTEKQTAANRENAQKSTGPKTPEGRDAVRLNGLKHGLSAETLILPGENADDFNALLEAFEEEHEPATPTEQIFVQQIAMATWRLRRLYRQEAGFYREEHQCHASKDLYKSLDHNGRLAYIADWDANNENFLTKFHRFEVRLERTIRTALKELSSYRAQRIAKLALVCDLQPAEPPKPRPNLHIVTPKPAENPPQPDPEAPEPLPTADSDAN